MSFVDPKRCPRRHEPSPIVTGPGHAMAVPCPSCGTIHKRKPIDLLRAQRDEEEIEKAPPEAERQRRTVDALSADTGGLDGLDFDELDEIESPPWEKR